MDTKTMVKIALLAYFTCALLFSAEGQYDDWNHGGGGGGHVGHGGGSWGHGGGGWGHGGGGGWGRRCRCARYCRRYERYSGRCGYGYHSPRRCCPRYGPYY